MSDPPPPRSATYGALLRNRRFLLLVSRQYAGSIGYTVYLVTILWLSYNLSHNVLLPGIVLGVETAVYTLSFLIGPWVDGVRNKQTIFLACYPVQAAAAFLLGAAYLRGFLSVPLLLGLVVVLALLWDFTWAADTTTSRLLFDPGELFGVTGLGSALGGPVNIVSYLTAGSILVLFGPGGGAFLYGGLLLLGTVLALPLAIPSPASKRESFTKGFRDGWGYFRGEKGRPLRQLAVLQSVYGFFAVSIPLMITLFASRYFESSTLAYAELYVGYLLGGIGAGLLVGHLNPRKEVGNYLVVFLFLTAGALLLACLVTGSLWLSVVVWFSVGLAYSIRLDVQWTWLQGAWPPEALARINANSYLFNGISNSLGAFAFGLLALTVLPLTLGLLLAAGFLAAGVVAVVMPDLRRLSF